MSPRPSNRQPTGIRPIGMRAEPSPVLEAVVPLADTPVTETWRAPHAPSGMTARQVRLTMVALLGALFTAMLSSTIVTTALPTIIGELEGTQRQYTWVITTYLLLSTMSTPIWGKLADLFSKKRLAMVALSAFVAGSLAAGAAPDVSFLIACRAVAGIGMGGLTALTATLLGVLIPPRERSRYAGYMGALMALSIVTAPLIGGLIVDSPLGWRWTFYVSVPLALVAVIMLHRSLHLTTHRRPVRIDYLGAVLICAATALPLFWVTFAGHDFPWWSPQSAAFVVAAVVALGLALVVEWRAADPFIPVRLLCNASTTIIIVASVAVGLALWSGTTFLTSYFQIGHGYTATHAGLLIIPLTIGVLCASTGSGEIVARTGRWKHVVVAGATCLLGGLGWLGAVRSGTATWQVCAAMTLLGVGIGAMMQNLVLAVQNVTDVRDMGAITSAVAFFRSLGGAVGVGVLGAALAMSVQTQVAERLVAQGGSRPETDLATLDLAVLPAPVVTLIREAYGDATGHVFLLAAGVALVAFVAVLFVREVPLRSATHADGVE